MTSPKTKGPSSSYLEEEIIVKPSTELIADEYEHFNESSTGLLVYTFAAEDQDKSAERFMETLDKIGLKYKGYKYSLEKDNCLDVLNSIDCDKADGLIIFFFGFSRIEGTIICQNVNVKIEKIWAKFNTYNCSHLKNKPKIFLFEIFSISAVQMDSQQHATISYELAYDTPGEADMLIIHNMVKDEENVDFTETLCENIECFGNQEDIISIATVTSSESCQPIIISTLTRKFYFTVSEARGHHLTFETNHSELKQQLNEVKYVVTNKINEKKMKKTQSFLSTIKNSLRRSERPVSLRKPGADGTDIKNGTIPENKKAEKSNFKEPALKKKPMSSASKTSLNSTDKPRWKF